MAAQSAEKLGVFGDYILLEKIAHGGMGVVYRARQVKLQRTVALKMILGDRLGSSEDVQRFYLEAEAAAGLDHPGIVPIYEIGEHAGQHFFSMGLVEGGSLAERIKERPLRPRLAADLIAQVADAIAFAHGQGIIHRDLKPGNILLDRDGRPRVSDFGLAKNVRGDSHLTASGQIMGTPSYMPPEQASGRAGAIGPAADVYALGATLYCRLTGRPPFQAATPVETLQQVLTREPVSPRQLNSAVDRDLEIICLKCLQKETSRRYATASALADDLRRFLAGQPIEARAVGQAEHAWRWCRRNPLVAGLAAGIALSLLVGTIVSTTQWARADREARAARAAQRLSDRRWYGAEINLAHQDWIDGYTAQAEARLGRLADRGAGEPDARGLEWGLVHRLCNMELDVLRAHTAPARRVAFAPDGAAFASAAGGRSIQDSEIRIWRTADRRELMTLHPGWNLVSDLAYSADGRWIAAAGTPRSRPGEVRLWDAASGREHGAVTGESTNGIVSVALSPGGKSMAVGESNGLVRVVAVESGRTLQTLGQPSGRPVRGVAYSPDGRRLASLADDSALRIWDLERGLVLSRLDGDVRANVRFSPDGALVAAAAEGSVVQVWDAATGRAVHTLRGHSDRVISLDFSPDGRLLASAGKDRKVRLWDLATDTEFLTLRGNGDPVLSVAFSPDGWRLAAAGGDGTVRFWDVLQPQGFRLLHGHRSGVKSVAFHPGGGLLASAGVDAAIRIFDIDREREIATLLGHPNYVYDVAFHPDGSKLASAGDDGTVRIWETATGNALAVLLGHRTGVESLAFSPDGARLVSGGARRDELAGRPYRGELILWDVKSGKSVEVLAPAQDRATRGVISPWATALMDGPSRRPAETTPSGSGTAGVGRRSRPFPATIRSCARWPTVRTGPGSRPPATTRPSDSGTSTPAVRSSCAAIPRRCGGWLSRPMDSAWPRSAAA